MGLEQIVEKVVNVLKSDDEIEVTNNGVSVKSENSMVTRIVKKQESKRIVSGPVLVPGEEDNSGDVVSKDKIEELAHDYMMKYGNVDKQHQLANKAEVVESYITPTELSYKIDGEEVSIPQGSWWLSVKVIDDETWQQVENEELNGFSIMAVNKNQSSEKSSLDAAKKGFNIVNLADLESDYEVNYVSLVDAPDVPKAKFASVKNSHGQKISSENNVMKKYSELSGTLDEALRERKEAVKEAIESTFMDVVYVYIKGIFETEVVAEVETQEGWNYYRVPYEYDGENQTAEINGEAEEVEIKKVVAAKSEQVKQALEVVNKYQEVAAKEGRVLSEENKSKLQQAKKELSEALDSIEDLLNISTKKEGKDVEKDEVQQVVKSTLEEIDLETTIKEEVNKALEKQDDETEETKEDEASEEEQDSEDEGDAELDELEAKVNDLEEQVTPKSQSLDGQDVTVKNEDGEKKSFNEFLGRDAMGRKVK